ncbi:MAG: DUF2092 domain-containing protein [Planctomycetia bacterium]|nr:DUF2092 domain-containing protein [Planctomycetia bacterium]
MKPTRFPRPAFAAAGFALFLAGCVEDPRAVIDAMGRAYRTAEAYSDEGVVVVKETRGDVSSDVTFPFRVAFSRPDRIRIDAYDTRIAADGVTLRGAVGAVPGQVLTEPVKSPLSLDQIFADEAVQVALAEGEAGCPTQLPLLLADDTVELIVAGTTSPPRIEGRETVDGHACDHISIPKQDGVLELWIDRQDKILRRMKVPTEAYADELSRQAAAPVGISVVVDFTNAAFGAAIPPEAFAFEMPPGAAQVSRLEPLEPPSAVHRLVGRKAEWTTPLTTVDGEALDRKSLAGAPTLLDFFFEGCGPAAYSMPQVATGIADFSAAHARTHGGERPIVRHFAVSLDPADVPTAALRKTLAEFGGVGTLVRDPQGVLPQELALESFPVTVIIAADGTVADVITGRHGRIAADVAETLAAAEDGAAAAQRVRDRYARRLQEYRRDLDRAASGSTVERLPEQVIAPRRQPVRFKLERVWRAEGVSLPGNVVCIDAPHAAAPIVVALDGWRTVVELDAKGQGVGRHELPLPRDAGIAFLRTAVDQEGRRWWLGGRRGGQHVFVFSSDWKLHTTYPAPGGTTHDGITAAELADLDGDGTLEIVVGYLGTVGVQAASLDGRRLWRDRSVGSVADVAVGAPVEAGGAREVLCVTGDGRLVRADRSGGESEADDGRRESGPLQALRFGPVAPDAAWALLGIAGASLGKQSAVGIEPDSLATSWELPLGDGVHRDGPIDPVAWADLLGTSRRQWLIAAPDGSVTVAWADGRVVDRYQHGRPLVGIGGFRAGDRGHIVLATKDALEAFEVADVALD